MHAGLTLFSVIFEKLNVESTGACCSFHPETRKTFKHDVSEKSAITWIYVCGFVCSCICVCNGSQDEGTSATASSDVSLYSTSFSVTSAELIG